MRGLGMQGLAAQPVRGCAPRWQIVKDLGTGSCALLNSPRLNSQSCRSVAHCRLRISSQGNQMDRELMRLQEIERLKHARLVRLSGTFSEHPEVIKAAKDLWAEAATAVSAYQGKRRVAVRN